MTIGMAIVGFGKIARNEHLPAIQSDDRYHLAAVVSRENDPGAGAPWFKSVSDMIAGMSGQVHAVALCTPPTVRYALAKEAISAGLGVMLEKPPSVTLGGIAELECLARAAGTPLYTAWHSQHAPGVAQAAEALAGQEIASLKIAWREDVRKWHPGQNWIWEAGGFGVFDTGINALSIASRIMPCRLLVKSSRLLIPSNRRAPIAAEIVFTGEDRRADFDWRVTGGEEWSIEVATTSGTKVLLEHGGEALTIDGKLQGLKAHREYPSIYDRFASVQRDRIVQVDAEPLRIAADAFLCGLHESVEAFVE